MSVPEVQPPLPDVPKPGETQEFKIVQREEWTDIDPRWKKPGGPVSYVLCTYTGNRPCFDLNTCASEIKFLQQSHMKFADNSDIRYNFLIGGDGKVYEGRGWRTIPRVPKRFGQVSDRSLYIAFLGKYKFTPPSARMFRAKDDLILEGVKLGFVRKKILIFTM